MINLMYIILTAMLALYVSNDVIDGFRHVSDSLGHSNNSLSSRNSAQYAILEEIYSSNPEKAGVWHEKGLRLREVSDSLFLNVEALKLEIAREADGKDGDPAALKNADDLDAASAVMQNPISGNGRRLMEAIISYSDFVAPLVGDSLKGEAVRHLLADNASGWEQMFGKTPAVAAVTLLSKIQNDIRQAESEALAGIITAVDSRDLRVNSIRPYVIPNSGVVMRGGEYTADVVLAAVDTTSRPAFYLDGKPLPDGKIAIRAGGSGTRSFEGYAETRMPDGSVSRLPFKGSFNVIEPMATVSATMMNVLYAGIDNPLSISVPGVPLSAISATMTNGTLIRNGDGWTARPGEVGENAEIRVSANIDGRAVGMGSYSFRVRKLPDPSPFISVKDAQGNTIHYKGTPRRISRQALLAAPGIGAAIDDDLLNVSFSVVSFSTMFLDQMGNAIPEVSDGASFSQRQKEQFRRLKPGKSFFITNVKAKGPDGIIRDISPMEVSLN